MRRSPRRVTMQIKLNALLVGSILTVAAGLVLISYYVFCQRVDEKNQKTMRHAAEVCAQNIESGMADNFWKEVNSDEFREIRDQAEQAGDEQIIRDWLMKRPGWYELRYVTENPEEEAEPETEKLYFTLMDDYGIMTEEMRAIRDYLSVDSVYLQYVEDGVTYNIADPDEKLFYIGTREEQIDEFADYPENMSVPPTYYRSSFGWLCTAVEPIVDPDTGKAVAAVGVDIDMTEIIRTRYAFLHQCIVFVIILLIAASAAAVIMLRRTALRPLKKLSEAATAFAREDRGFTRDDVIQLDLGGNDEISDLYYEIRSMENRIVDYTENLARVTAERERVNTELSTASRIQESMLPGVFPAFPERDDFDLYASMTPAKEVGGDFYDFFLIDSRHLAVLIADVSDKGIPAALFMMASKILLNYRALLGGSPSEILTSVNTQICKNNKSRMFVTVWLGILDVETGILTCANAGHEYPAVRGQDGVFRLLKNKHGMPVGALARSKYTDYEIRMMPGDAIFVYTDGVPEARSASGEFYGMERMEAALNRIADRDPQGILEGIRRDVDAFTGDARQYDDLTMLCLEYRGPRG